jgi:hypothetical protein
MYRDLGGEYFSRDVVNHCARRFLRWRKRKKRLIHRTHKREST